MIAREHGSPAAGGIFIAGDDSNAFEFQPYRAGLRRLGNRPNSGKTNVQLTAEKLWGNPAYPQPFDLVLRQATDGSNLAGADVQDLADQIKPLLAGRQGATGPQGIPGPPLPQTGNVTGEYLIWDSIQADWVVVGCNTITLGANASSTTAVDAIRIGQNAGTNQSAQTVAIGTSAGQNQQGSGSVAIGYGAGLVQSDNNVGMGYLSGNYRQGLNSVTLGAYTGAELQGWNASSQTVQGTAVAIGDQSANQQQDTQCVAIGAGAGANNQGSESVAIGFKAGQSTLE